MRKGFKSLARRLDRLSLALFVGVLFGLVAAILVLATPVWLLEQGVQALGLPEFLPAAAPPLGTTARGLAAAGAGVATGGVLWLLPTAAMALAHRLSARQAGGDDAEVLVAAPEPDADLAARRPIFAESGLGAPFMSDEAIAHAQDELLLDVVAPEEDASPAPLWPEAERLTIPVLLDRLEAALERRERRTGSTAPLRPADLQSLRAALGESTLYH